MNIRSLPIGLGFLLTLFGSTAIAQTGGLQGQMDQMFGQMSTASSPQVALDAQRGVVSGGALQIRSPVTPFSAQALNFTPPSFSGGCSGISLYGGSFSFISGQQFVQMLRSIAANSEGLAFQMAMQAMSNQLSQQLSSFSDKMQSLTGTNLNSCHLAQTALDKSGASNAISNFGTQVGTSMSTDLGLTSDTAAAVASNTPSSPIASSVAAAQPDLVAKIIYKNVVWDALQSNGIGAAFGNSNAIGLQEDMMALTGTVVVCNPQDTSTVPCKPGLGDAGGTSINAYVPLINLEDLVYGNTGKAVSTYSCGTDTAHCMTPKQAPWTSQGFLQMVNSALGTNGSTGVIGALLSNNPSSPQVQAFISNAGPTGPLLLRVAQVNPGAVTGFAQAVAQPLALDMAYQQATQMITVAETALQGDSNPAAGQMITKLNTTRRQLDSDYNLLRQQSAFSVDALKLANIYIETAPGSMPADISGTPGN